MILIFTLLDGDYKSFYNDSMKKDLDGNQEGEAGKKDRSGDSERFKELKKSFIN